MADDAWNLTPAEATARLEAMKPVVPATGLAERMADEKWRAGLLAGNGPQLREFSELMQPKPAENKLDAVLTHGDAAVPLFETTVGDELSTWKLGRVVADLRADGLEDGHIREMFAGEPIEKELHDAARRLQQQRFADPQYVDHWLKGGAAEKREQLLIGIILGRPIAGAAA